MYMDQWTDLLVSQCFLRDPTQRGRLNVTSSLLNTLGLPHGLTDQDFVKAARNGFEGLPKNDNNVCSYALELLAAYKDPERFAARYRDAYRKHPPFIGYLGLFVYVESLSDDGFHRRLWDLFPPCDGPPRTFYPTFNRIEELWRALHEWSLYEKDASPFRAATVGGYRYVGALRAQLLLTDQDRSQLPALFWDAELDPSDHLSLPRLQQILRDHPNRLRERTSRIALAPSGDTGEFFQRELLEDIRHELRNWDGYKPHPTSTPLPSVRSRCVSHLRLFLRPHRGITLPELRFCLTEIEQETTASYQCVQAPGIIHATAMEGVTPPLLLNNARWEVEHLDWARNYDCVATHTVHGMPERLRFAGRNIRLFLPATPYHLRGYAETDVLPSFGTVWIAANAIGSDELSSWLHSLPAASVRKALRPRLPDGWVWHEITIPTDPVLRMRRPPCIDCEDSLPRIALYGGFRIARTRYHAFAPPRIVLHGEVDNPVITISASGDHAHPLQQVHDRVYCLPESIRAGDYRILLTTAGELRHQARLILEDVEHAGSPRIPAFLANKWGDRVPESGEGWSGAFVTGEELPRMDETALQLMDIMPALWAVEAQPSRGADDLLHGIVPHAYFASLKVLFSTDATHEMLSTATHHIIATHQSLDLPDASLALSPIGLIPHADGEPVSDRPVTFVGHMSPRIHSHSFTLKAINDTHQKSFPCATGIRDVAIQLDARPDDEYRQAHPLARYMRRHRGPCPAPDPQYVALWTSSDQHWTIIRDNVECCRWQSLVAETPHASRLGHRLALFRWLKCAGAGVSPIDTWPLTDSHSAILGAHPLTGPLHKEVLAVAIATDEVTLDFGIGSKSHRTFYGLPDRATVSSAARQTWQLAWIDRLYAHHDTGFITSLDMSGFSPVSAMASVLTARDEWKRLYTRCLAVADMMIHLCTAHGVGKAFRFVNRHL